MALQDEVYRLRNETKEAFDRSKALEARWRQLEKEQRDVYQVCPQLSIFHWCSMSSLQRFDQQFLLMRLRHATTAQDDQSEALASSFIQSSSTGQTDVNGKDIDDFVKEFRELRKTYHKRVIWGDRWAAGKVDWHD